MITNITIIILGIGVVANSFTILSIIKQLKDKR
jgi:hypothetical protein